MPQPIVTLPASPAMRLIRPLPWLARALRSGHIPSCSSPPLGGEARRGGFESSCNPLTQPLPLAGERSLTGCVHSLGSRGGEDIEERRDTDDTPFPIRNTAGIRWDATRRSTRSRLRGSLPASIRSDVMSSTTGSRPTSSDLLHGLRKSWQRGVVIESALIASFVAFTIVQFLFVVGIR